MTRNIDIANTIIKNSKLKSKESKENIEQEKVIVVKDLPSRDTNTTIILDNKLFDKVKK